jgi:hypothetical protein
VVEKTGPFRDPAGPKGRPHAGSRPIWSGRVGNQRGGGERVVAVCVHAGRRGWTAAGDLHRWNPPPRPDKRLRKGERILACARTKTGCAYGLVIGDGQRDDDAMMKVKPRRRWWHNTRARLIIMTSMVVVVALSSSRPSSSSSSWSLGSPLSERDRSLDDNGGAATAVPSVRPSVRLSARPPARFSVRGLPRLAAPSSPSSFSRVLGLRLRVVWGPTKAGRGSWVTEVTRLVTGRGGLPRLALWDRRVVCVGDHRRDLTSQLAPGRQQQQQESDLLHSPPTALSQPRDPPTTTPPVGKSSVGRSGPWMRENPRFWASSPRPFVGRGRRRTRQDGGRPLFFFFLFSALLFWNRPGRTLPQVAIQGWKKRTDADRRQGLELEGQDWKPTLEA